MSGVVSKRYRQHKVKITYHKASKGRKTFNVKDYVHSVNINPVTTTATNNTFPEEEMPSISGYMTKRISTAEEWASIRMPLINTFAESSIKSRPMCVSCSTLLDDKYIICNDCSANAVYCQDCCLKIHEFVHYHKPTIWMNEMMVSVPFKLPMIVLRRSDHNCQSQRSRIITVVDQRGRQHDISVIFCDCESDCATLVRHSLWPSSPRLPRVAFDMRLMDLQNALFLEGQVSVQSFVSSLESLYVDEVQITPKVKHVYRALVQDAVSEYQFFKYACHSLKFVDSNFDDGSACPACPVNGNCSLVVSVDANFGLVRKRSAGQSQVPSNINVYFLDQKEVDEKMNVLPNGGKNVVDCNDFKAGSKIRSSVKNNKLDETAIFGMMCKHELPMMFCNIKGGGEKLGYSIHLLEQILKIKKSNQKLVFMYDIACQLQSFLKRNGMNELLHNVTMVVPAFHNYGHRMSCQLKFNPRRNPESGLSDGECLERLWAYLRKYAPITKCMSAGRRVDALSLALLNYASKARRVLAERLNAKLSRAVKLIEEQHLKLNETISHLGYCESDVEQWCVQEVEELQKRPPETRHSTQVEHSTKEQYAHLLYKFRYLSPLQQQETEEKVKSKLSDEIKKVDAQLASLECKLKIIRPEVSDDNWLSLFVIWVKKELDAKLAALWKLCSERRFLLSLLHKYCAGQAIAKRLGMQLKTINKAIRSSVVEYNELLELHPCLADQRTEFDDVIRDDWSGWQKLVDMQQLQRDPIRRTAIDIYQLMQCAITESEMCRTEMNNVLEHLNAQHIVLMESISKYGENTLEPLSLGIKSLLISRVIEIEAQITIARQQFPPEICEKHVYPDAFHSKFLSLLCEYDCNTSHEPNVVIGDDCEEDEQLILSGESDDDSDDAELCSDID